MKKMKMIANRKLVLVMMTAVVLAAVLLTGCGKASDNKNNNESVNQDAGNDNQDTDADKNSEDDKEDESKAPDVTEDDNKEKIQMNIAALKGPTGMGMVKLMEDAQAGTAAHDYQFTVAGEADVVSTGLIKGEFDIAAVPCNLASVLYNKTNGQIKLAGINTLSVLYIVETGNEINSVEDLKGKTIYSTGYGTTPQYTLNYLLSSYGLDPEKDLTIEYKSEATEVAAILESSENAVAMLPQPYVTTVLMNNDKVRIALDIEKEWAAKNENSGVVTGVVVVNSEFLNNHPEAVEDFLNEYKASAEFVNNDVDAAAELIEKFDLFKAAVAKKAIPYCNITLIQGTEMKEMARKYLNVLYEQNPNAVGGELPDDNFYFINE